MKQVKMAWAALTIMSSAFVMGARLDPTKGILETVVAIVPRAVMKVFATPAMVAPVAVFRLAKKVLVTGCRRATAAGPKTGIAFKMA